MRPWLRLAVLIVVGLLVACSSDEPPSASSPAASDAMASSGSTATTVPLPEPTSDRAPGAAPTPELRRHGSWVVDVRTGTAVALGDDATSGLALRNQFEPRFTPDGSGVWLSRQRWSDARRYALDGAVRERIDGVIAVREGPQPGSRTYYEVPDGGDTETLIFEHEAGVHRIAGRTALPAIGPGGDAVAFYSISEQNDADLVVLDRDGNQRIVATEVDPCPCDLTPRPDWSPSGSHIAYYDFSGNDGAHPFGAATFLVEVQTGERRRLADMAPPGRSPGWLSSEAGERLVVTHEDRVAVFDLATGGELTLQLGLGERPIDADVVAGRAVAVRSVLRGGDGEGSAEYVTTLFDGVTGAMLGRWELQGSPTLSADGAALVLDRHSSEEEGCLGVLVVHPRLAEPRCLADADSALWSPDGSMLAVLSRVADGRRLSVWDAAEGVRELAVVDTGDLVDWNAQGTHVLVSDVTGL